MFTRFLFLCSLLSFSVVECIKAGENSSITVEIRVKADVIRELKPQFLSVTMDASFVRNRFPRIDWNQAIKLGRYLSPSYLRVGGTDADYMLFDDFGKSTNSNKTSQNQTPSNFCPKNSSYPCTNFKMTSNQSILHALMKTFGSNDDEIMEITSSKICILAEDWDRINWFVRSCDWKLVFNLNAMHRDAAGAWSVKNATALLQHSEEMGYDDIDFELGNEPNHYLEKFNMTFNATQMVVDLKKLRAVLRSFKSFSNSKIIGPDNSPDRTLEKFLAAGGGKALDAVSIHHYYGNGRNATEQTFVDPTILDSLIPKLKNAMNWTQTYAKEKSRVPEVWLGETSSLYNSGAQGLSDRYIAGFMWLDKLGLAASLGLDAVFRQTYFNGNYALLDKETAPNPDYWLSVLYKKLVGSGILNTTLDISDSAATGYIRFYAHCADNSGTIYGMNLWDRPVTIKFKPYSGSVSQYLLEPKDNNLTAKSVLLNGEELIWDGHKIPDFKAKRVQQPVVLPSKRFAFYVFPMTCISR